MLKGVDVCLGLLLIAYNVLYFSPGYLALDIKKRVQFALLSGKQLCNHINDL